jgi:hypothetical protein
MSNMAEGARAEKECKFPPERGKVMCVCFSGVSILSATNFAFLATPIVSV